MWFLYEASNEGVRVPAYVCGYKETSEENMPETRRIRKLRGLDSEGFIK